MTVKEICKIVEDTKIFLFERGCVFDGHVDVIEPDAPIPTKYADRKVFQLESVGGDIYLIMDK